MSNKIPGIQQTAESLMHFPQPKLDPKTGIYTVAEPAKIMPKKTIYLKDLSLSVQTEFES